MSGKLKRKNNILLVGLGILCVFHVSCKNSGGTDVIREKLDPYEQTAALGKGVNFGNLLDCPQEGDWSINHVVMEEWHFTLAKSAGFDSIRIPIKFSGHALKSPPYTIDEAFMRRVDQVVGWGLARGLKVVVDMHHYDEIHADPLAHADRFVAMWKQIAARYSDYSKDLYFELLNEPNDKLEGDVWNLIVSYCIHAIREIDGYHTVIVSCGQWSNNTGLNALRIPDDESNVIVTFHYYNPSLFCFQGQAWAGADFATTGIKWPGPPYPSMVAAPGVGQWVLDWFAHYNGEPADTNPAGTKIVQEEIAEMHDWSVAHNRPLWMGEFTAQGGADMTSRVNWTEFVRKELEKYGIPWSIWTLLSGPDSYLYDVNSGKWVLELTGALGLNVSN